LNDLVMDIQWLCIGIVKEGIRRVRSVARPGVETSCDEDATKKQYNETFQRIHCNLLVAHATFSYGRIQTRVPSPATLIVTSIPGFAFLAVISPPCRTSARRAIARPRPTPPV